MIKINHDYQSSFPGCCGISVVHGLNEFSSFTKVYNSPAFMATTISSQKRAIKQLKAAGFKPVSKFTNSDTNRKVTIWFFDAYAARKAKRKR